MKKRIKLEVSSLDIGLARQARDSGDFPQCSCPIKRALGRTSEDRLPSFAAEHVLVMDDVPYKVSRSMKKFMRRFDQGGEVQPTTFWITEL